MMRMFSKGRAPETPNMHRGYGGGCPGLYHYDIEELPSNLSQALDAFYMWTRWVGPNHFIGWKSCLVHVQVL